MPKRHRIRARARRPATAAPGVERVERDRPDRPRPRYRGAPLPPGGAHAIGEPSAMLVRAAALERTALAKDFARLGKVVAVVLALLVLSGFGVQLLLR